MGQEAESRATGHGSACGWLMDGRITCLNGTAKIQQIPDIYKYLSGNLTKMRRKNANPAPNSAHDKALFFSTLTNVCGTFWNFFMKFTRARACTHANLFYTTCTQTHARLGPSQWVNIPEAVGCGRLSPEGRVHTRLLREDRAAVLLGGYRNKKAREEGIPLRALIKGLIMFF